MVTVLSGRKMQRQRQRKAEALLAAAIREHVTPDDNGDNDDNGDIEREIGNSSGNIQGAPWRGLQGARLRSREARLNVSVKKNKIYLDFAYRFVSPYPLSSVG